MGFRPEPTIYNLDFSGTYLEGLEIRATCCSVGEYRKMLQIAAIGNAEKTISEEGMERSDWVIELMLKNIVSWNLEDMAGQPVPVTKEGLNSQEERTGRAILSAWQTALITVPPTSQSDSSDGGTSEEASLGLGSQSENHRS